MRTCKPLLVALFVMAAPVPGFAQNMCDAGKLKCMRSKAACLLKVHERAIKTGTPPDGVKIAACRLKFDDPLKGCIAKLEAKQSPEKPATLCSIVGNTAFLEARVDDCIADALVGVGSPGGPSTCDSGKLKCMRSKAGCILKVHEKALKTGTAPDGAKVGICQLKFDDPAKGCVAKLEAKQNVQNPATLCANVGDTAALEAIVDACVAGAVDDLTTCPADVESPEGLTATGALILHQNIAGVDDVAETGDRFGAALATGDLDGDGFDDLVVGIPGENGEQGAYAWFNGSPNGLDPASSGFIAYGACPSETGVRWGSSLAVGDYYTLRPGDELVIGGFPIDPDACKSEGSDIFRAPFTTFGVGAFAFHSGLATIPGAQRMTFGDFTGDGVEDFIGIIVDLRDGGLDYYVLMAPGSEAGLSSEGGTMALSDIPLSATIASGDFDANPIDDIVIGYPGSGPSEGGQVELILNPFTLEQQIEIWHQNSPGMVGASEFGDGFGWSLAVGDFNGDGHDDLMVGVPGEDAAENGQGAFHRIFGDGSGLTATGNQLFGALTVQADAAYGSALAAGRFDNADAAHELAVGAPSHDVGGALEAGYVDVRFGSATNSEWSQGPVPGTPESGDHFGAVLAVGDFNGDGADDLAIGVPDEDVGTTIAAGAVNVLYGTPSQCLP